MDSLGDKDHKTASQPMNGGAPFDAGQYSFFDSMGDDAGLEGGLDGGLEGLEGGLEEGVEVPPEEDEVPIEEEVDLAQLGNDEPEDLSYAAMFAHTLKMGDSMQTPQKLKESLQWNSAASADPVVQPPSAGQARAGSMSGYSSMEQTASSHMPYGAHSLPSPSPWNVYMETPGQHHSPAPGPYQSPGLHGLQGLDMAQISQGISQPNFHQSPGHASLPRQGMQPSMAPMHPSPQQQMGQQPQNTYQAAPLPQPQQPPKIMTMEEVEAQLRRKSQLLQQQQRQQAASMPGADLGMLGSPGQMGPPPQPGLSMQQPALRPVQPEQHMHRGPPGFPSPGGPPQQPSQYNSQQLGPQPSMGSIPGPRPPAGPPPPMPTPERPHMPMHAHPFPPPPPGVRGPPGPQLPGMSPGMPPPGGPAGFPGMPGPPFSGMQHMRGHPGPSAWQRPLHHMMGPRPPHMMPPMAHYPPMPPPMLPSPENLKGADLLRHRCMYGSKLMSSDEIENILRIQEKFLTSGVPYNEDYYYLACKHKHKKLHEHALHYFAPEALRDAAPASRPATEDAAYAKLEGLGKIPFSNIRRPRPLMDLMDKQPAEPSEEATPEPEDKEGRRRLEDEPLLAARIVVEECLNVLLDLDDLDRLWVNAPGPRLDKAELQKRRSNLLEVLGRNLRVPRTPQAQKGASGDGVFMRLMALPKGRSMLTRALRVLYAPPSLFEAVPGAPSSEEAPLHISWALLRNVRTLYGCASQVGQKGAQRGGSGEDVALQAAERDIEVTSALAGSAVELLSRLDSPAAVNQCVEALVHGDLQLPADGTYSISDALLPLYIPGEATSARRLWLADIFVALLQRAQELGLSSYSSESRDAASKASSDGQQYHALFNIFYKLIYEHIASLVEVYNMATAAGMTEAADYAKSIAPVNLIRALMPHTSDTQRAELLSSLNQIQ